MIGDNIRKIAKDKNITIYQIFKKSGVSKGYLYDIVNGKELNPTIKFLTKVAKALDVPVEKIIKEE